MGFEVGASVGLVDALVDSGVGVVGSSSAVGCVDVAVSFTDSPAVLVVAWLELLGLVLWRLFLRQAHRLSSKMIAKSTDSIFFIVTSSLFIITAQQFVGVKILPCVGICCKLLILIHGYRKDTHSAAHFFQVISWLFFRGIVPYEKTN